MKTTRKETRQARRDAQRWRAKSSDAATPELMANVFSRLLGEEAKQIMESCGS
jgi:hypothetical protein